MVSATDVITYIGVPLAVLGVSPIFYTFTLALYTRLKLQRVLRQNGIEPRIRARLMTGVVEVDLPVLQLYTPHREDQRYWLPSASPKTVLGASWSIYNFESREIDIVTCRLQRSDKITLPEAKVEFKKLLEFLQDMGCYPDLEGFRILRTRGQNTAGTSLMCVRESQLRGRSNRTILEVAKPGDRHGLVSLRLANLWMLEKPLPIIDPSTILPLFSISGSLLELHHDVAPLEIDNVISTVEKPDESIKPISSIEKRRYFLIRLVEERRMQVTVHEIPAPSNGIELSPDHLKLLGSSLYAEDGSTRGDILRHWFACAAIAVYGFPKRQSFYRFLPNQRLLHNAQVHDIEIEGAIYYGLVDAWENKRDKRLDYVNNSDLNSLHATNGPGAPQTTQSTDGRHRIWMTEEDLRSLRHMPITKSRGFRTLLTANDEFKTIIEKFIAMQNLLRLCLHWLTSNPIQLATLSIGSLPEEPWDLDKLAQHTSDLILRMIILDIKFAKEVKSQIDRSMSVESHPLDLSVSRPAKHPKAQDDLKVRLTKRSSREVSGHFCCAMVLLAIIGERAAYLLSGQDVKHCENEWRDVYLS